MKIKVLLLISAITVCLNAKSQLTIEGILSTIQSSIDKKQNGFKLITETEVKVNSTGNAFWKGGTTNAVIPITIPIGTEKWYYRVTVLKIEDSYNYENNEKFYYLLQNNKKADTYSGAKGFDIDFFMIGHSGNKNSFLKGETFTPLQSYRTNSFIYEYKPTDGNLWIGIRNINSVQGLRVIVEAVAYGKF